MTLKLPGFLEPIPWSAPKPEDIVTRQSWTQQFLLCPMKLEGMDDERFDDHAGEGRTFGSTVHGMIERLMPHLQTITTGRWPSKFSRVDVVRSVIEDIEEEDGFLFEVVCPSTSQRMAFMEEVIHAVRRWHEEVWLAEFDPDLVLVAEHRMVQPLGLISNPLSEEFDGDRGVWIGGTPDIVLAGRLIDWKTTAWEWRLGKTGLSKGDSSPQASTYAWLWEQETGEKIREMSFYVYDRKKAEWSRFDSTITDAQIQATMELHWQVALAIHHGALPATPWQDTFGRMQRGWHCSAKFCGSFGFCDGVDLVPDGTPSAPRKVGPLTW